MLVKILLAAQAILAGLIVVLLIMLPQKAENLFSIAPENLGYFITFAYGTAVFGFFALAHGMFITIRILKENPFDRANVSSLHGISIACLMACILYTTAFIFFFREPTAVVIATGSLFLSIICAVIGQLLQKAIDIKEENDLTF